MKLRTQIQLDGEDYDALKRWASLNGTSMSGAVRRLVRERLRTGPAEAERRLKAFLAAAGSLRRRKGEGAVSRDHDCYLYGSE